MANKVYINDIGTKIKLDAGVDISTKTVLEIRYKKPDNSTGSWTAIVEDSNYAVYVVVAGDLDQAGTWEFQIYVELPAWEGHGETVEEIVYALFD